MKQINDLKEEIKALKEEISEKVKIINEKDQETKALVKKYESKLKDKKNEDLKEIEELRNDRNVIQMLFDDFKEEMTYYKYVYDSSAETSDEELVYGETRDVDNNECSLCGFKGKTSGGLKTHIGRKHRDREKSEKCKFEA